MDNNIPLFKVFMSESVLGALEKTLYSGFVGEGPKVAEFETLVNKKLGFQNSLALNSGTAGLHLAYQMITNYDKDSEIIVSPMTCSATITPIIALGAKVVWADVDPVTGNISVKDVLRKVNKNTKAIVAVHWGGNPCDVVLLNKIAKESNCFVIEDAAHALGSTVENSHVGNFSDFTIFSFQAIKHVTSVDGGLLVCKNKEYHDRAKLLRWYGIDRDQREVKDLRCELDLKEAGHKMHMNDVNATIAIENFNHLDSIVTKHQENAKFYDSVFASEGVVYAKQSPRTRSSYWLYTIHAQNRDELMAKLKEQGIMNSKVHARNDHHSAFLGAKSFLPGVDSFSNTHLCIPVGWWLTSEDRNRIVENVLRFIVK